MEQITLYRCEFCNTQYSEKKKAENCENNHLKAKKVRAKKYLQNLKEPRTVIITMDNGEEFVYENKGKFIK